MEAKKAEEEAAEKRKQEQLQQELEAKQKQLEETLEHQEKQNEKEREAYKNVRKNKAAESNLAQESEKARLADSMTSPPSDELVNALPPNWLYKNLVKS